MRANDIAACVFLFFAWYDPSATMPQTTTPPGAERNVGKDELNLADWRIGVATHQQPRKENGEKLDVIEYEIPARDGRTQRVTLMAPAAVGLPTPADEDLLMGLLCVARQQYFESDTVRFSTSQLCDVMHKVPSRNTRDRIEKGLTRLKALTIKFEFAWYDRVKAEVEPILITGILAEAKLMRRNGRPRKNEPVESHVQWTKSFYNSIKSGNLTSLDLDLYFSFSRPGTKQLYRHLNKRFYGRKCGVRYERDLIHLACGHLGMKKSRYVKRNLHQCIQELEKHGYILAEGPANRYRHVRPGAWRVGFTLAPAYRKAKQWKRGPHAEQAELPEHDAAATIVREFHRLWSGVGEYRPGAGELVIAKELIRVHDAETIRLALPSAVRVLRKKWPDCRTFRGVERYLDDALEPLRARRDREQARCRANEAAAAESQQQADKERRRADLERIWNGLPLREQEMIRTDATRGHLPSVLRKNPRLTHSMCLEILSQRIETADGESRMRVSSLEGHV